MRPSEVGSLVTSSKACFIHSKAISFHTEKTTTRKLVKGLLANPDLLIFNYLSYYVPEGGITTR